MDISSSFKATTPAPQFGWLSIAQSLTHVLVKSCTSVKKNAILAELVAKMSEAEAGFESLNPILQQLDADLHGPDLLSQHQEAENIRLRQLWNKTMKFKPKPKRHVKTAVLMFSWEGDDLKTQPEVRLLVCYSCTSIDPCRWMPSMTFFNVFIILSSRKCE